MPDPEPFNEPSDEEKKAVLDQFDAEMRAGKARLQSISPEELNAALSIVTDFLRTSWTAGGGQRLQHFVWSLWNGWHVVNLAPSHGLNVTLSDAVTLFRAVMFGALKEGHLRCLFTESGENEVWFNSARQETKILN